MQPQSWLYKIIGNPVTRIFGGLFVCGGGVTLAQLWLKRALHGVPHESSLFIVDISSAAVALLLYMGWTMVTERRPVGELGLRAMPANAFYGLSVGVGLQTIVIAILLLVGCYSVVSVNGFWALGPGLGIAISSGVVEEIIFRGVLFRIIEESLGSVIALVTTSLLFGLAHIMNPNATVYSATAIAIEAGIMLGAAFMATRSLWFPIFLHFGWNFAESGIFGTALSGFDMPVTFITSAMHGPVILTGGKFGPENSILALILCVPTGILLLRYSWLHGHAIRPFWRRRSTNPIVPEPASQA